MTNFVFMDTTSKKSAAILSVFNGAHAVILKLTYLTFRNVSGKQWRAAAHAQRETKQQITKVAGNPKRVF